MGIVVGFLCRAAYFWPTDDGARGWSKTHPGRQPGHDRCHAARQAYQQGRRGRGQGLSLLRNVVLKSRLVPAESAMEMGLMSTEPPHVALYDETLCEEGPCFHD